METSFDINEESARLRRTEEFKQSQKRRSKIKRSSRHHSHISDEVYIFAAAYAQRRRICIQDAIDEFARIGISQIYKKESRENISPKTLIRNYFRGKSKINKEIPS